MKKNDLIVKSNQLIESGYRLSAIEQKLILSIVSMVNPKDKDFFRYKLKISDFMELSETKGKTTYKRIRQVSKRLMQKVFEIQRPNSVLQLAWFSSAEYFEGEGYVEIGISPLLKPYLLGLKKCFTRYQLGNVIKLKSFYSIRIYELLKQYEQIKVRIFALEKLREVLGIPLKKYKLYADFTGVYQRKEKIC